MYISILLLNESFTKCNDKQFIFSYFSFGIILQNVIKIEQVYFCSQISIWYTFYFYYKTRLFIERDTLFTHKVLFMIAFENKKDLY